MSGAFVVDTDRLEEVVQRLAALGEQAEQIVAAVDSRVRALQVVWTGDAATAEQGAHAEWVAGAHEMHDALTALRQLTDTAHANYSQAVAANTAMWS